jgi:hypothetical protein
MAAKVDTPAPQLTGLQLYSRFALAGAVCCSVTHGALTPVDVYVPFPPQPPARHVATPAGRTVRG